MSNLFKKHKFIFVWLVLASSCSAPQAPRILVFSKTMGFHHESITAGTAAIQKLGEQHHLAVDTTTDAAVFNEENLKRYQAVIFLNTTGDVLNREQENDFERYIQAGGGFVGIHAATDTEYGWPWYGKLVGAYFDGHPGDPNVRKGVFNVVDKNHPSTDSLPDTWERMDEFYSFKQINPDIKVLIKIDEKSYGGGKNGDNHPMAWYHDYDGGRAFYTNLGHTNETYSEPLYLKHLWGGINYAIGGGKALNYSQAHTPRVPSENRFTRTVLDEKLDEPMELTVLPGNRVLFVERKGAVRIYDPAVQKTKTIANIAVSTKYVDEKGNPTGEAEDGLLGVAKDPGFETNHWVYFYYSPAGTEPKNVLARYELKGDELVESSRKIILEVGTQRHECCHTGGSIAFDSKGNLFVSTGDNSSPRSTGYSPSDERPGRNPWDAQKSSANTNDLRGKVLRIHPESDGSYTIPEGNLFPKGTDKTRPEIYVMGGRNPFRISVDQHTGFLYWGEVGPDAGKDSIDRGPKGHDEVNQARKAGYFGWPYFVGNNKAYRDWDFAMQKPGPSYDSMKPINRSPNNTGLTELPPAQKAFIWYPYDESPEFPLVGKGGRTAMAGPVYYKDDFKNSERPFPDYYNGKLFIYEWMRGWVMAVTMDNEGNYVSMEQFMPGYKFANPMDMEFSSDGDLYVLEYGTRWFQGNDDARLLKISYNGGNRKPEVHASADRTVGAVPLSVNYSAAGTKDPDRDEVTYAWKILGADGTEIKSAKEPDVSFTFDKPGIYKSILTVTDAKGETSSSELEIQAGNEPPVVSLDITRGNKTFFFKGQPFDYEVTVNDAEDGSLANGRISADQVSLSINYLKDGIDPMVVAQGHLQPDASVQFAGGKKLMEQSDCKSCHTMDKKSIGPMYREIATKYKGDAAATDRLANKVINGGGGVWGDVVMAAHPQLSVDEAKAIVGYVLSLAESGSTQKFPVKGAYTVSIAKGESDRGDLVLNASYSDKGANSIPSLTTAKLIVLRSPSINAGKAPLSDGVQKFSLPTGGGDLVIGSHDKSFVGFQKIDLSGISNLVAMVIAPTELLRTVGGILEVRIDSPNGPLVGQSTSITPAKVAIDKPVPVIANIAIASTDGAHDVYLVFKNENNPFNQPLFILLNVEFVSNPIAR